MVITHRLSLGPSEGKLNFGLQSVPFLSDCLMAKISEQSRPSQSQFGLYRFYPTKDDFSCRNQLPDCQRSKILFSAQKAKREGFFGIGSRLNRTKKCGCIPGMNAKVLAAALDNIIVSCTKLSYLNTWVFMTLPLQHHKELFSRAFLRALAAKAEANVSVPESDYGNDFILTQVITRPKPNGGFRYVDGNDFKIQLKCTHEMIIRDGHIVYALEAKNYSDLIDTTVVVPKILVLVHVPESSDSWLTQENDHLVLRHSAHWISLRGLPVTSNTDSVTIEIPEQQHFTPEAIQTLFKKRKDGELL